MACTGLLRICSRPECTDRPCYVNTRPRSIDSASASRISVSCPSQVAPEGATNVLRITNLSSASTFGRSGCACQGALRPTYHAHAFRIRRTRSGGRRGPAHGKEYSSRTKTGTAPTGSLGGGATRHGAAALAWGGLGRAVDALGLGGAGRSWRRRRAVAEKATPTTRETSTPAVA